MMALVFRMLQLWRATVRRDAPRRTGQRTSVTTSRDHQDATARRFRGIAICPVGNGLPGPGTAGGALAS
jgi:hypothetical protein